MNSTYAQKSSTVQKAADSKAASVLDSSAQSESLQRKADMANNAAQRAEAPRPNNTGMPDNLKAGIESLSGFSMDNVRVHYNSSKPATVQALAYTQGTDIHVAPGQEKCLPHEAWHVAQQMAGRVSPTTNINGMPVNDNAALEHEADVMGEKAVTQRKENFEIKLKNVHRDALQLKPGEKIDLICAADVLYKTVDGEKKCAKGVGFNDSETKEDVLLTFREHGLYKLANGGYTRENPAGQCAEPHAFANAIKDIPKDVVFLDVYISDAVVRKNGKINPIKNMASSQEVKIFSRCSTCAQWIQNDGHVKQSYLVDGKNDGVEQSNENASEMVKLKKRVKKTDDLDFLSFDNKKIKFHNVNFLKEKYRSLFPRWFFSDSEVDCINKKIGLRTIIKKQMLKNRKDEMIEDSLKRISVIKYKKEKKIKDWVDEIDDRVIDWPEMIKILNIVLKVEVEHILLNEIKNAKKSSYAKKNFELLSENTQEKLKKEYENFNQKKEKNKEHQIISSFGVNAFCKYLLSLDGQNAMKKVEESSSLNETSENIEMRIRRKVQWEGLFVDSNIDQIAIKEKVRRLLFIQHQQQKMRRQQQRDCNRRQQLLWKWQIKRKYKF